MPKFWIDLSVYNMELLVIGQQPDRRLALIPMDRNRPMGWPDQEFDGFPSFTPAEVAQEIWVSDLPLSAALLRRDLWTGEFPDAVFRDGGDLLRDVSVPDVAAALALPGQNFKAAPLPLRNVPAALRPFLSPSQIRATEDGLRGEEKDFFAERMDTLAGMIAVMPKTYESDGKGDNAMVHLHYFHRGADWYITEKDSDPDGTGQVQAFGLADLGMGYPEMGYISIQEITRLGAEMDYHFAPRSLLELKKEKYPEMIYATVSDSPVRFYADHADRTLPDGLLELNITEGTVNSLRESGGLAAVLASEDLREKHADGLDAIIQARAQSVGAVWMEDGWERDANRFLKDGITVSGQGEASLSGANLVSWGYHLRLPDGRAEYVEDRFGLSAEALVSSLKDRIALMQAQILSALEMVANADNDLPVEPPAYASRARESLNQSIAAGMSFGDLAGGLRALDINATMSSDDINQFFHMPVPADTMLLSDAADRHEDTVPMIRLPENMSIVAWKADLDAYLALQESPKDQRSGSADTIQVADTETSLPTDETRTFLEERFGSDAAFGVSYIDEDTGHEIPAEDLPSFEGSVISAFPDGSIPNCTNYARHVQNALPAGSVRVVGFSNEENPNSDVVREGWHPGGHDFAIVDNRYLVDPWAKLLAGVRDRVVYDLQDEGDARLVARTYGSPGNWFELPEAGGPRDGAWDRRELRLFTIRLSAPIRLSSDAGAESTPTPAAKRQDAGRTIPFAKKDLARGRLMRSLEGLQSVSTFIREHGRSYNSDMVQAVIDGAKSIRRDDILGTREERLAWLKENGHDVGQVLLVNALYNLIPASAASMPDMSSRGNNRNSPDAIAFRAMAYTAVLEEIGKRLDALPVEMTQRHWKSWLVNPYLELSFRPGMVESGEGMVETRNMIGSYDSLNSRLIPYNSFGYGKEVAADVERRGVEAIRDLLSTWPGLTPGALVMDSGLRGKGRTCSQDLLQAVMRELDERPSQDVPSIWERVTGDPVMSRSSVYPLTKELMDRFANDDNTTEIYWRDVSEGLLSLYPSASAYRSVIMHHVSKQPDIMDCFLEHNLLPVVCNYGYDAKVPAVKEARGTKPQSETIPNGESWNDQKKSPDAPYGDIARNLALGTIDPSPRNGRDITDEEFVQDTGFSVQYGNYVNNKERQALLNMAYDGLYDMAAVLDVPVHALAVRKDGVPLGLALGARGSGRAMAHYDPGTDTHVINLTKTKGAGGNMIHEWLHAVDATMGKEVLSLSPTLHRFASHFGGNALNDFVRFAKLPPESVMNQSEVVGKISDKTARMTELWRDRLLNQWVTPKLQESFASRMKEYLEHPHIKPEIKAALGDKTAADYLPLIRARIENIAQATAEGIATGSSRRALVAFNDAVQFWSDLGRGVWTYDEGSEANNKAAFLKMDASLNDEQARMVTSAFTDGFFDIAHGAFKSVQRYVSDCHKMSMQSDFYGEAAMMDAGRKKPYWSSPHELLARAGSAVFYDKSREMGIHNDFLDVYSAPESFSGPGFKGNPNPEGAERLALKAHFEQQTLPALRSFLMANLQKEMAPQEMDRQKVAGSDISL